MMAKTRKTIWGFDPNWLRVEHLDDEGQPLGYVTFERRVNPIHPQPQASSMGTLTSAGMRAWSTFAAMLRRRHDAAQA